MIGDMRHVAQPLHVVNRRLLFLFEHFSSLPAQVCTDDERIIHSDGEASFSIRVQDCTKRTK